MKTKAQQYVEAIERGNLGLRCRLEAELDDETAQANARLDAPEALKSAALWYAKQGIAVFPCQPNGKRPIVEHGFKDASIELTQIESWWTDVPLANIGAPTGVTFDVIDVDGPEGVGSIYFAEPPVNLPPEIGHALTPRTAGHHLFIAPTGRGCKTSFMPGVDYRGAGGYVILPPSRGANGRRYQWTRPIQLARAA